MGMTLQSRLRWLMGATALLYLGPLLAGLGGFGWLVVPVFTVIFVLWLIILRPQEWPRNLADWQRPEALVALAARAAVQLLLVALCFGIGRGLGGVLGARPAFPVVLPIAISLLSIPLARLIWDPWKAKETDGFLDDAITRINGGNGGNGDRGMDFAQADALLEPLAALPADVTEDLLAAHLRAMAPHASNRGLHAALVARAERATPSRAVQKALIVHATDLAASEALQGEGAPAKAFAMIRHDAELLDLFARRCTALIEADPLVWGDCPPSALVRAAASSPLLIRLADALDRAAPRDA